mgnify:CR=1 FL=1
MSVSPGRSLLIILVVAAVTLVTRALPFLLFRNPERTPRAVVYLGKVLPPATMAMLVVYCLKGVSVTAWPFGLPELIAVAAVVLLHLWKRNNLLSICGGTVLYMVLIQVVFP